VSQATVSQAIGDCRKAATLLSAAPARHLRDATGAATRARGRAKLDATWGATTAAISALMADSSALARARATGLIERLIDFDDAAEVAQRTVA
jgi:hypothetical protein